MIKDRISHYMVESNRINDIKNLKPDSHISVFHGSDHKSIYDFCLNGIDARKRVSRLYPHYIHINDKNYVVSRGLFVSPELATSLNFGRAVVKFKVLAKDLFPPFPHPSLMRDENKSLIKVYPNSFRPALTQYLLSNVDRDGGKWNDGKGGERQALFRGLVSPRAIEKVFIADYDSKDKYKPALRGDYHWACSKDVYLDWFIKKFSEKGTNDKYMFEPQEDISVGEFFNRILNKYPDLDIEYVESLFVDRLKGKSFQEQIKMVQTYGGSESMSWSFAKKMTPKLLKYFKVERGFGERHQTETYYNKR